MVLFVVFSIIYGTDVEAPNYVMAPVDGYVYIVYIFRAPIWLNSGIA